MKRPITEKQALALSAVVRLCKRKRWAPTLAEVGAELGISKTAARWRIERLIESGFLAKRARTPRSLHVREDRTT